MRSFAVAATVASLASFAAAQSFATGGQGRFPCSTMVNGIAQPDPTQCEEPNISNNQACPVDPSNPDYGQVDSAGFKNYGAVPTGATCAQDPMMPGNYYCGFAGAPCTSDANCDNGYCGSNGQCQGRLGAPCTLDSECSGSIYCLNSNSASTGQNICGYSDSTDGTGAICDDGCAAGNFLCISGACDGSSGSCFPSLVGASQRAKARRNTLAVRGLRCPASHTACPVSDSVKGFECIDTTSNLEQCGACAASGGVDCTSIEGAESVGCVEGRCEIWACAENFQWDSSSASCVRN